LQKIKQFLSLAFSFGFLQSDLRCNRTAPQVVKNKFSDAVKYDVGDARRTPCMIRLIKICQELSNEWLVGLPAFGHLSCNGAETMPAIQQST